MTPDLRAAIERAEEYIASQRDYGASSLAVTLNTLLDAVKGLERDAERYREVRGRAEEEDSYTWLIDCYEGCRHDDDEVGLLFDAAIDAAIAKESHE